MNIIVKLKETCISVVPIILIVLLLNFTIAPVGAASLIRFLSGGILVILGLTLFLVGADIGIIPIGQKAGAALTAKRSLFILVSAAFAIGFFITIAEPDVQVLAAQIVSVSPSVPKTPLIMAIAIGVGFFIVVGLLRIVFNISYNWLLIIFYGIVGVCAFFTSAGFIGLGFDAGGATTGPMTVPFIIALGVGVASSKGGALNRDSSFGLTGMASIGPIMAVLILGIICAGETSSSDMLELESDDIAGFLHLVPGVAKEMFSSLMPLAVMFLVFQFTLIHMPPHQVAKMIKGLIYTYIGLVMFMTGVEGGFMPVGFAIGSMIGGLSYSFVLIPIGLVLGAVVVCAEPAVWVLNEQIEEISGGHIKKRFMQVSLSVGVSVSIGISMLRVLTGISIWYFLIPGYLIAMILTFFTPKLFTAIAFDSGGVASGPMTSTFILSFTLGASAAAGGNPVTDAFGVIAMVAMTPLITIQLLGLIFSRKTKEADRRKADV
ncbi:MAG: DUF1538 domain-containing protein [Spirochaetia bacterium]|nr:DUF1538 domain-containing protein [Spirochaetia bacterium]